MQLNPTLVGPIVGAIIVLSIVIKYLFTKGKMDIFSLVFALIGLVFFAFPFWKTFTFSAGADGTLELTAEQLIGDAQAETNAKVRDIEENISNLSKAVMRLSEQPKIGERPQADLSEIDSLLSNSEKPPEFIENSQFSVLVFHKKLQETNAERITEALLDVGYRSSSTATNLTESRQQFSAGTVWLIWTTQAENKIPEIRDVLGQIAPDLNIVVRDDAYKLQRGDIQLLIF